MNRVLADAKGQKVPVPICLGFSRMYDITPDELMAKINNK